MNFSNILERPSDGVRFDNRRHDPKVRALTVSRVERITPAMARVVLHGPDLKDFESDGFDDHIKVLVPTPRGHETRDYTPRRFDAHAQELMVDFAIHDAGPAASWAAHARPGDRIEVAGPKKSSVAPAGLLRWLLIGDETALPAIGRFIEEAGPESTITSLIAVTGPEEEQVFTTRAQLTALWAHRPLREADRPDALVSRLHELDIASETFV